MNASNGSPEEKTETAATAKTTSQPARPGATANQWPGAFAAYGQAFEQVKKNPQPALIIVGTYAVLSLIATVIDGHSNALQDGSFIPEITWLVFLLALPVYALAIADKRLISNNDFFKFNGRRYLYLLAASILATIIVFASALLLLIPLIWTVAWFALVEFPVADKSTAPVEALKESKRLAANHKAKVWGLIGATIALAIPAVILSFIPLVGAIAVATLQVLLTCALAILYRWLQRQPAEG